MTKNTVNDGILVALIWPFAGLINALNNWRQPWAKNAFWLVCTFMGAVQIFQPEGTVLGDGADGGRYVIELKQMYANVHSYSEVSSNFYDGDKNDVFAWTLMFLVSRFTDNGHFFFFILAIIYGFFYSRNVWYILCRIPNETKQSIWVLIASFFLISPIWFINGVRMYTALHVFCYGALPYLLENDKKKLLWCMASLLVHQSFLFPILLILVYAVLPQRLEKTNLILIIVSIVYFISLSFKALNLSELNMFLQMYMPSYYDNRIDGYVNEERSEILNNAKLSLSKYILVLDGMQFWSMQYLVISSILCVLNDLTNSRWFVRLFVFALLFSSFANIASNVPSGGRYITIANMFLVSSIIFSFTYLTPFIKGHLINSIAYTLLAITLLFDIRLGFDFYGIDVIFGNLITAIFVDTSVPLIDYVKLI